MDCGKYLGKVLKIVQCSCSRRNELGESPQSASGREIISKVQRTDMPLSKKACWPLMQSLLGGNAAHFNAHERGHKKTFHLRNFQTPGRDLWHKMLVWILKGGKYLSLQSGRDTLKPVYPLSMLIAGSLVVKGQLCRQDTRPDRDSPDTHYCGLTQQVNAPPCGDFWSCYQTGSWGLEDTIHPEMNSSIKLKKWVLTFLLQAWSK